MRVQATISAFQHFSFSAFHRPVAAPQNCKSPLFLRGSLRWGRNSKSCFPDNEILTRILTETCIDNSSAKRDNKLDDHQSIRLVAQSAYDLRNQRFVSATPAPEIPDVEPGRCLFFRTGWVGR